MQRTKIEWTDYTWNPIKGLCPVGCWYCYARKIYKRFIPQWRGWNSIDEPFILADEFIQLDKLKKPSKIFVCSTFELFHPSVKKHIHWVFNAIEKNPQHTFQILTKFPQNIDRPMPDNVWLGVTLDGINPLEDVEKSWALRDVKARIKFYSFEPLIDPPCLKMIYIFDWAIIGRLTGYGRKFDPKKRWIEEIIDEYKSCDVPIFLKNNLKEIWQKPLIQEFPKEAS